MKLTKAQQEIYDAIETEYWFEPYEYFYFTLHKHIFRNVCSQCSKIQDKGFLESKLVGSIFSGNIYYRKVK